MTARPSLEMLRAMRRLRTALAGETRAPPCISWNPGFAPRTHDEYLAALLPLRRHCTCRDIVYALDVLFRAAP